MADHSARPVETAVVSRPAGRRTMEDGVLLQSVRALNGYTIGATDGHIGRVRDAYFDDRNWHVRYLVVDTDQWLTGRRVLIPPLSLRAADHEHKVLRADVTKAQVADSPDFDTEKPVSRQHEIGLYRYYFPTSWAGDAVRAGVLDAPPRLHLTTASDPQGHGDLHLRSAHAVTHHYVHAIDGDIGHVADFLYEDPGWRIGYLVVATGTFRPGRKVLVPIERVMWVSWSAGTVDVGLRGETIRLAPEYDAAQPPQREYLARLAAYYAPRPEVV